MEHRPRPYGYTSVRVPHTVPAKAAQGRTRSKLAADPARSPVITPSTPATVAALLTDPRTDSSPDTPEPVSSLAQGLIRSRRPRIMEARPGQGRS